MYAAITYFHRSGGNYSVLCNIIHQIKGLAEVQMMTMREFRESIRVLGNMTAIYDHGNHEYRVNLKGGSEDTAYYTDDRQDALDTARAMSAQAYRESLNPRGVAC